MPDWWEVNPQSSVTFTPDTSVKTQGYYDTVKATNPTMYETIKSQDPKYIAQQQASAADRALQESIATAAGPDTSTATPSPDASNARDVLQRLGTGFESRLLPDALTSPFVSSAISSGRSKADQFIANMLKRGTLSPVGRAGATAALDTQAGNVRSRLDELGRTLLGADRAKLTDLANRDATFEDINAAGQGFAGSFGSRFNAALPPGDLFDTSGLAAAGGAITGPQNISFDPYAQAGGTLKTGLGDTTPAPASGRKRTTAVF